jgi:hypothetical protein
MRTPLLRLALPLAAAGTIILSACSGTATTSATPASQSPAVSTAPQVAGAASSATQQKVNANTASVAELQQAFEAAGISNAARWAREVDEYRPYPTDDPSFAKLRGELAKYNPGQDVVERIVATLSV